MMDNPGVLSALIDVESADGIVTLKGKIGNVLDKEHAARVAPIVQTGHLTEKPYTLVEPMFRLPNSAVDESKVETKLRDGVFYLTVPKSGKEKAERIEVK
jgi:HSP20 family molecular chaperone IbpA